MMQYNEIRNNIQNGDVLFFDSRPYNLLQQTIRLFTGTKKVHVGIAYWIVENDISRLMVIEAQGGSNRRIVNIGAYCGYNMTVVKQQLKLWKDMRYCLDRIGIIKYSYTTALIAGVNDLIKQYFGKKIIISDKFKGEICSEFVARVLDLPDTIISPGNLYDYLKSTNCIEVKDIQI